MRASRQLLPGDALIIEINLTVLQKYLPSYPDSGILEWNKIEIEKENFDVIRLNSEGCFSSAPQHAEADINHD